MTPFYESQSVTIYNARWEDVWPTLGLSPRDVALCWADPPYGIGYKPGGNGIAIRRVKNTIVGDFEPFDPGPLLAFPRLITWGANHYAHALPASPSWLMWDKRDGTPSDNHADGELAWSNLGGPLRIFRCLWRGMIKAEERGMERFHPTQKPVALCEWGFERAGLKPGDLVFAPYLGSGPEVRAAMNMGLRLIGCEVDADYCRTVVEHRVALAAPRRGQEGQSLLPFGAP